MSLVGALFTAVTGIPCSADRALLDTLCLAAVADGAVSEVEDGYALEIALDLEGFRRVSREKLVEQIAEAKDSVRKDGDIQVTMRRIAKALGSAELREQAYTLAAVIVGSDMKVLDVEKRFLEAFSTELGIAPERAAAIWSEISKELESLKKGDGPKPV